MQREAAGNECSERLIESGALFDPGCSFGACSASSLSRWVPGVFVLLWQSLCLRRGRGRAAQRSLSPEYWVAGDALFSNKKAALCGKRQGICNHRVLSHLPWKAWQKNGFRVRFL